MRRRRRASGRLKRVRTLRRSACARAMAAGRSPAGMQPQRRLRPAGRGAGSGPGRWLRRNAGAATGGHAARRPCPAGRGGFGGNIRRGLPAHQATRRDAPAGRGRRRLPLDRRRTFAAPFETAKEPGLVAYNAMINLPNSIIYGRDGRGQGYGAGRRLHRGGRQGRPSSGRVQLLRAPRSSRAITSRSAAPMRATPVSTTIWNC